LTGFVSILSSLFASNQLVDFHLNDTYFLIEVTHVFWFLAAFALFFWMIYFLTSKILFSKILTRTHIIITILTFIVFIVTLYFGDNSFNSAPRRYYDYNSWNSFYKYSNYNKAIVITIGVLLMGQIIFLINFAGGIFKNGLPDSSQQ
jgi:cytochrome c oxidase subunit 1